MFPLFSIVKIPNQPCVPEDSQLSGTCFTKYVKVQLKNLKTSLANSQDLISFITRKSFTQFFMVFTVYSSQCRSVGSSGLTAITSGSCANGYNNTPRPLFTCFWLNSSFFSYFKSRFGVCCVGEWVYMYVKAKDQEWNKKASKAFTLSLLSQLGDGWSLTWLNRPIRNPFHSFTFLLLEKVLLRRKLPHVMSTGPRSKKISLCGAVHSHLLPVYHTKDFSPSP